MSRYKSVVILSVAKNLNDIGSIVSLRFFLPLVIRMTSNERDWI